MTELLTLAGGISADETILPPGNKAASVFLFSGKVSNMIKLKDLTGALRLMSLALALAFVLSAAAPALLQISARADEGTDADKGTWKDLILLYTTDIKGKIEPCG